MKIEFDASRFQLQYKNNNRYANYRQNTFNEIKKNRQIAREIEIMKRRFPSVSSEIQIDEPKGNSHYEIENFVMRTLMHPINTEFLPNDSDYAIKIFPFGRRCLLFSKDSLTTILDDAGYSMPRIQTNFPGGFIDTDVDNGRNFSLLEGVICEKSKFIYIVDVMNYCGYDMRKLKYYERENLLTQEINSIAQETYATYNDYKLQVVSSASPGDLSESDGVLFYKKNSVYESGKKSTNVLYMNLCDYKQAHESKIEIN